MASSPEKNLQELLRLLTTTRKLPILQAMTQVKALQAANLRSIQQIAEAPPDAVKDAIKDAAAAKSLQTSCKTALKKQAAGGAGAGAGSPGAKRSASGQAASESAKRAKASDQGYGSGGNLFGAEPMTPAELEQSLALPVVVPEDEEDEARIANAVVLTNRAPLVLAFTVELLRYTMPEQPVSSRLSLAQAVVSANSRSKAVSLGIDGARGPSADEEGWGTGQPRIRVMGREISVLKRSGYTWRGEEEERDADAEDQDQDQAETNSTADAPTETPAPAAEAAPTAAPAVPAVPAAEAPSQQKTTAAHAAGTWSVSQTITIKDSTFVARATTITDAAQRGALIRSLMERNPKLMSASHNAWSYRVRGYANNVRQDCFDDGETACGELMLRVMNEVGAVDTLVVLTRWFGGTLLGPDRFRLMRNCVTGVLSERLRLSGAEVALSGEAAWGLDLEAMREKQSGGAASGRGAGARYAQGPSSGLTADVGMPIHRPEGARQYLLKSFASYESEADAEAAPPAKKKKKTLKAQDAEKEDNLGLLLGALRIVYDSWADHISAAELDRRAWGWYVTVRPDVDAGPAGWGAKGQIKLKDILRLRRKEPVASDT
ncbi:impact protein [Ophiostoma piceae UAMH 11346]|uniref:Impact protein n=1 Tax=Ophiostoma piceae (strain UAMH 11346) TaxID=1262450 RepID=S3BQY6_OPHP1|nr:impact protein [Ophiostoma piceae UAMH 11346]